MAHYAKLNEKNIVEQVVVIDNSVEPTEAEGIEFCRKLFKGGIWRKTSYNNTIRKNFAGPGFTYDMIRDAFIPPNQFPSWRLDEETCRWVPPTPMPQDGSRYQWDEITLQWRKLA